MTATDVVFVVTVVTVLGGVWWLSIRSARTCICCRPRRRFGSSQERAHHEKVAHSL